MRSYIILFIIGILVVLTGVLLFVRHIDIPMAKNFIAAGSFIELIAIILIVFNVAKKAAAKKQQ